jgi:hypothetical protein
LSDSDQLAVVTFLKTLQMPILPPNQDPNVGMPNSVDGPGPHDH